MRFFFLLLIRSLYFYVYSLCPDDVRDAASPVVPPSAIVALEQVAHVEVGAGLAGVAVALLGWVAVRLAGDAGLYS